MFHSVALHANAQEDLTRSPSILPIFHVTHQENVVRKNTHYKEQRTVWTLPECASGVPEQLGVLSPTGQPGGDSVV